MKFKQLSIFILALVILGPIGVFFLTGVVENTFLYLSKMCFFSWDYYCGQVDVTVITIQGAISFGCFLGIKVAWDKSK